VTASFNRGASQLSLFDAPQAEPVSERRAVALLEPAPEPELPQSAALAERSLAWSSNAVSDLIIQPSGEKGRSFQATLLASVTADALWSGGSTATDDVRPVWSMYAGSEQSLRAFVANLRCGRKAAYAGSGKGFGSRRGEKRLEVLKSAHYQLTWQRADIGSLATLFLPDLFRADPGMVDPVGASFVLLPPRSWADAQTIDDADVARATRHVAALVDDNGNGNGYPIKPEALAELVPIAALFAVYLDRRVRLPLVADLAFYLQLLLACLDTGLASWSETGAERYRAEDAGHWGEARDLGFDERGTAAVGLLPGVALKATHEAIGELLAEQATIYFQMETALPWPEPKA
jgi:hypothetical protein